MGIFRLKPGVRRALVRLSRPTASSSTTHTRIKDRLTHAHFPSLPKRPGNAIDILEDVCEADAAKRCSWEKLAVATFRSVRSPSASFVRQQCLSRRIVVGNRMRCRPWFASLSVHACVASRGPMLAFVSGAACVAVSRHRGSRTPLVSLVGRMCYTVFPLNSIKEQ